MQDLVAREARRLVNIRNGDDVESVPKLAALVRKLFSQALAGDLAAARLIIQSANAGVHGPQTADVEEPIDPSKVDDEALKRMLARFDLHSEKKSG